MAKEKITDFDEARERFDAGSIVSVVRGDISRVCRIDGSNEDGIGYHFYGPGADDKLIRSNSTAYRDSFEDGMYFQVPTTRQKKKFNEIEREVETGQ